MRNVSPSETFKAQVTVVNAWIVSALESAEMVMDRLAFPGNHAPDVMRALDAAAVEMLREILRTGDALRGKLDEAQAELVEYYEEQLEEARQGGEA